MVNQALSLFTQATMMLNRVLAWADFIIHYISGYIFYYLLGGYAPQFHTRPSEFGHGEIYSPSVLITGASQGIGLATSLLLASKGYNVYAGVKDESEREKLRFAIKDRPWRSASNPGSIRPLIMDVLSPSSLSSAVSTISSEIGSSTSHPLVAVINNAGYCMISPMELTPDKAVRDLFELDFWAYISVIRAFLPLLKKSKGRFINVASYGAYVNPPMWVPYSAAKAAVEAMSRAWRFELMPLGVGITSVRPGYTRTHGIGPKITAGFNAYFSALNSGETVAGVDSLGDVVQTDILTDDQEKQLYGGMMRKWHRAILAAADGAAQTAEAVAATIHDALTDAFLQPNYTVGYDALLGQMVRDLTPESLYEAGMMRAFQGKGLERMLSPYKEGEDGKGM